MKIYVKPASEADRVVVRNLLQLHLHDLSAVPGQLPGPTDVNEEGLFEFPNFEIYWCDDRGLPFLITVDDRIGGFVLAYRHSEDRYSILEFFVLNRYRRKGVGTEAAIQLLASFHGECEIAFSNENEPAVQFWENVARKHSGGGYRVVRSDQGDWKGTKLRIQI